mmetsp:Transcript_36809/g.91649  ORF Transcript_36809/g.91649 Transcript_36809/m.91649 type:complete len:235 (+) Transcript_36809:851-1555(+)
MAWVPVLPNRTNPLHAHLLPSLPQNDQSLCFTSSAKSMSSASVISRGTSVRHWQILSLPGKGSVPSSSKAVAAQVNVPGASPRMCHLSTSGCAANQRSVYRLGSPVLPNRAAELHVHSAPSFAHHFHAKVFSSGARTGIMHWQILLWPGKGSMPPSNDPALHAVIPTSPTIGFCTHLTTSGLAVKYPLTYMSLVPVAPKRMWVSHAHRPPSFAHQSHFISGTGKMLRHSQVAPG